MRKNRYIFILYFLAFTCSCTYSQEFSYLLPDTGYQALVQKKIDLRGGLVILSIALAPGFEDLPTLAYYRLKQGAKIGCIYFTNGEDVPNYEYGKTSYETAKQRKEEAYQVISVLGGEAFFLNVPALSLSSLENTSLIRERYANKLETIISEMKPDVILVNSDYFFPDGKSNRIQLLRILLEQTAAHLKKNNQWNDFKIFIQTEDNTTGHRIPVFETNSLNKKSYFEIANDIRSTYKSMLKLFPVWTAAYWPCYTTVFPKQNGKVKLSKINHPLIPQTLQTINLSIKKIVESEEDHLSVSYLNRLQAVIQIIDGHINNSHKNRNLNSREVRLLLFWKKAIEDLRCAIHNVTLHYVLRDKSVTASQVFFVKIGSLGIWAKNGKTQLIFPGVVEKDWIVDTRQDYSYPLFADTSWLVMSPNNFQLTAPVNEEGYKSLQMRNTFTFMVVHKGLYLRDNFVYQRDIPLLSVPHQSIEILKPDVVANCDSIILVKITNNLFNAMEGEVLGEDSVVTIMPYHISLPAKAATIDSLRLKWKKKFIGGKQPVSLKNKRERSIGSITYRGLEITTEHSVPVGVLSVIDNTPLLSVLRYIGCTVIPLDTIEKIEFKKISAIIIDEQASVKLRSNMVAQNQLKDWIRDRGTMVMFSQYGSEICPVPDDSVMFQYHNVVFSHQDITVDINQWSNKYLNNIRIHDLYNEGSIISFGGIQVKANLSINIPLQTKSTKMPLIVTRKYGQGNIIYVALHLYPQILSIQPETYKLFVNLLSN